MSSSELRSAPLALWRVAAAFLATLGQLFGPPEAVAARHTMTAKPYRLLLAWIRAGEALMRRLLLIEAAACPKPNARPLLHPRRARVRKLRGFTPDKPEDWRVSFRCFYGPRASRPPVRVPPGGAPPIRQMRLSRGELWNYTNFKPTKFHSAWPLAERYEALLRVFNNPAPYARRLARRLYALPHRARELTAHPPNAPALVGGDSFASTGPPAERALQHFSSG